MKQWKFSKSQPPKLLGFGKHGRTLFKTIAKLVIAYHKKRKFSGHLLETLRYFPNLRVKHPFNPVENVTRREFLHGKKTDLLYMRYHFMSFFDSTRTYNNIPTPKLLVAVRVAELLIYSRKPSKLDDVGQSPHTGFFL